MPEIPNVIDEENVIIAPGQGKTPVSNLSDKFCEEEAFPHLPPIGKFGFNAPRNIPISAAQYFNQRLLNLLSILHQMQILFFLPGLCMSSTIYVHQ